MIASVDPYSGEVEAHPDFADRTDPALVEWLSSEQDEDMLELLYRFLARAKGYAPPQRRKDLDLDEVEALHLAAFDDLFDGVRFDEYILGGGRYWTSVYLCPDPGCDCHEARVVFFDDAADPEAGAAVGSKLLDLRGAEGFKVVSEDAESRAQEPLLRELWALFERRHRVGAYLRWREAQARALGATLWVPVAKPVAVAQVSPRRIQPQTAFREALRSSAVIIEREQRQIAYLRIWSWAGEAMQAQLLDVIGELNRKRPDAFVVDIRDGWGGAQPRYITIFDPQVPVLESKDRSSGEVYRLDTQIRAPAVVLINGGTRSGKEVIAYGIKKHRRGTLVGEKTAPFCQHA